VIRRGISQRHHPNLYGAAFGPLGMRTGPAALIHRISPRN